MDEMDIIALQGLNLRAIENDGLGLGDVFFAQTIVIRASEKLRERIKDLESTVKSNAEAHNVMGDKLVDTERERDDYKERLRVLVGEPEPEVKVEDTEPVDTAGEGMGHADGFDDTPQPEDTKEDEPQYPKD
jgi:hypothetical protein